MQTGEFTLLLERHRAGDDAAHEHLLRIIYKDLRELAHRHLANNRWVATLNTTSVVNESYLRLVSPAGRHVKTRAHFMNLASRVMRQIICDYARRRLRELRKRERYAGAVPTDADDDVDAEYLQATQLAELDDALKGLALVNERNAAVVSCRFFAGLSEEETAEALETSVRTVQRAWNEARVWLSQNLHNS